MPNITVGVVVKRGINSLSPLNKTHRRITNIQDPPITLLEIRLSDINEQPSKFKAAPLRTQLPKKATYLHKWNTETSSKHLLHKYLNATKNVTKHSNKWQWKPKKKQKTKTTQHGGQNTY